jgi:aryl-phospho-beta-D-glucosidase BglC (GH1 family)
MRSGINSHISIPFCLILLLGLSFCQAQSLPEASAEKLPAWHGFNLLNKFQKGSTEDPFFEEDFRWISELGFNFVRLPMDYRQWIVNNDWTQLNEKVLREIDQAVEYGKKYNIHVCINFHRAPGYTVAQPPESKSLWMDAETQRVCAMHWAAFARRYKGIPNRNLSFNLLNEPPDIDAAAYAKVVWILVRAIHEQDPNRLIIADGLRWGQKPCESLIPLHIAQATRGYEPFELTHYKANWIKGSEEWKEPVWPIPLGCSGYLYGPAKKELRRPIQITAVLAEQMRLRLRVGTVSDRAVLTITRDGTVIQHREFTTGPGEGPWKKAEYKPEWKIYQNIYDQDFFVEIPQGTHIITLNNIDGDWLTITAIAFGIVGKKEYAAPIQLQWGQGNTNVMFNPSDPNEPYIALQKIDRQWLWEHYLKPWMEIRDRNVGVMVGEWGAFNQTPHKITMQWMEDCLTNYRNANLGWAMWNFRGSFGILDSDRKDVQYEDFHGHKLDRQMLTLLQKYIAPE